MTDDRSPLSGSSARRVRLSQVARTGLTLRFEADDRERAEMAGRLVVLSVEHLSAELTVAPWRRDGASLRGRLKAEIVQESVVSLEPVRQSIDEPVDLTFLPAGSQPHLPERNEAGEIEIDPEGEDPPDVLDGDAIDVVAALEELVALAIDPYPRAASESFENEVREDRAEEKRPSPFAGLAVLKSDASDG